MRENKIHRTAGRQFIDVTLGGKTYRLRNYTLEDIAEAEAYVVAMRPDPLVIAERAIQVFANRPELHAGIIRDAMETARTSRSASQQEMANFASSAEGAAFGFWRLARKEHPEIDSVAKAREVLAAASEDERAAYQAAAYVASGEADLKNSDGPEASTAPGMAAEEPTASPGGPRSTEPSPSSTAGVLRS